MPASVKLAPRPYRVGDLVHGWIQRSYLKRDGWWAQMILDRFDFLLDLGFSLTSSELAGVHFHQKGNYIWFERRGDRPARITFDYEPDSGGWINATIEIDRIQETLDDFIARFDPTAEAPRWMTRAPKDAATLTFRELFAGPEPITDPAHIERKIKWWAKRLRQIGDRALA